MPAVPFLHVPFSQVRGSGHIRLASPTTRWGNKRGPTESSYSVGAAGEAFPLCRTHHVCVQ